MELVEFYLGIAFSEFDITNGEIPVRITRIQLQRILRINENKGKSKATLIQQFKSPLEKTQFLLKVIPTKLIVYAEFLKMTYFICVKQHSSCCSF